MYIKFLILPRRCNLYKTDFFLYWPTLALYYFVKLCYAMVVKPCRPLPVRNVAAFPSFQVTCRQPSEVLQRLAGPWKPVPAAAAEWLPECCEQVAAAQCSALDVLLAALAPRCGASVPASSSSWTWDCAGPATWGNSAARRRSAPVCISNTREYVSHT